MSSTLVNKSDRPEIKPRSPNFLANPIQQRVFFKGNTLLTAFACTLTAMFPEGEMLFIKSVRNFRSEIKDPQLLEDIRGFIGQEGHHQKIHRDMNQKINDECNLEVKRLEAMFDALAHRQIKPLVNSKLGHKLWLAQTVCAEHFTAILGEFLLAHPQFLDGTDHGLKKLFEWHAVEEIEHKAVAFDVYKEAVDKPIVLRLTMLLVTVAFIGEIMFGQYKMMRWSKFKPSWKDIKEVWLFNFGKDGIARNVFVPWLRFFAPGFHPWKEDSRGVLEKWKLAHPEYIES